MYGWWVWKIDENTMISNREIALPPYTRACLQECKAHASPPLPDRYPLEYRQQRYEIFSCNTPYVHFGVLYPLIIMLPHSSRIENWFLQQNVLI